MFLVEKRKIMKMTFNLPTEIVAEPGIYLQLYFFLMMAGSKRKQINTIGGL